MVFTFVDKSIYGLIDEDMSKERYKPDPLRILVSLQTVINKFNGNWQSGYPAVSGQTI